MYPLTHLYFAEMVLGTLDDKTILGSIFPDITVSAGIDWNRSHTLGMELWRHLRSNNKCLLNFSLGVISHGIDPKGLDYYSDEKYRDFEKGYCFEKARPLVDSVVEACNLSSDDGWWKAHNFIEMGIELFIYEERPELLPLFRRALDNVPLIAVLCKELALVLVKDETALKRSFTSFRNFFDREHLDAQLLAARFQKQIYFRYNIESIDLVKCQSIIHKGKELIASDIKHFFQEVKEQLSPVMSKLR